MPGNAETLLKQGINAAKSGDIPKARRLLSAYLKLYPDNEEGWLWLAGLAEDTAQQREYLERVIRINPQNARAKTGLKFLQKLQVPPSLPSPDLPIPAFTLSDENDKAQTGKAEEASSPMIELEDELTLSRFFANMGQTPPPPPDTNLPASYSGMPVVPARPVENVASPRRKEKYEAFTLTTNGARLLARNARTGGFALYSSLAAEVSDETDRLKANKRTYYRTGASLEDIQLDRFIELAGSLPERPAVEMTLRMCDRLLGHLGNFCWLQTGAHGAQDVWFTNNGDIEPVTGLVDETPGIRAIPYLPPEYGRNSLRDQRSDIYTICAILYFMLTGKAERLIHYRTRGRALLFEQYGHRFNSKLVKLLEQGLSPIATDRQGSIAELRDELMEIHRDLKGTPKILRPVLAAGVVLALIVMALLVLKPGSQPNNPDILAGQVTVSSPTSAAPATLVGGVAAVSGTTRAAGPDSGRLLIQRAFSKDGQLTTYFGVIGRDNQPVTNIKSGNLRLILNGREQPTFKLDLVDPASDPLTLLVVLDNSLAMPDIYAARARNGLVQLINSLNAKDQVGLVYYSEKPALATDIAADKSKTLDALNTIRPRGSSATFDALLYATELLRDKPGRKAILLVTTGEDKMSPVTQPSVVAEKLQDSGINFYALGYQTVLPLQTAFRQMAELSGGFYLEMAETAQVVKGTDAVGTLLNKSFKLTGKLSDENSTPIASPAGENRLTLQLSLDDALLVAVKRIDQGS